MHATSVCTLPSPLFFFSTDPCVTTTKTRRACKRLPPKAPRRRREASTSTTRCLPDASLSRCVLDPQLRLELTQKGLLRCSTLMRAFRQLRFESTRRCLASTQARIDAEMRSRIIPRCEHSSTSDSNQRSSLTSGSFRGAPKCSKPQALEGVLGVPGTCSPLGATPACWAASHSAKAFAKARSA